MPQRKRDGRKPLTSLVELDKHRVAMGVYLSKAEFIDAVLRPFRWPTGTAPVWAAHLTLRLARLFYDSEPHANLLVLTQRLLSSEERALAAQTVLLHHLPLFPETGAADFTLMDKLGCVIWDALELVAWQ